jgi:hypothetical protein
METITLFKKHDQFPTSTEYIDNQSSSSDDFLLRFNRISQSSEDLNDYNITYSETSNFLSVFRHIKKENTILKSILKNLWKNYHYQQEYASFLLGNYSKEEFMRIAKEYAEPFHNVVNKHEVMFVGNLASSVLQQRLNSSDLSILLNIDCSSIEEELFSTGCIVKT